MNVSTPKPWPFDTDGVQAVTIHAPGWTWQPMPEVFATADDAEFHVNSSITYWTRYTDDIELVYYGYDPVVRDDDGEAFGTDGYPDAVGHYDADTETVIWEALP